MMNFMMQKGMNQMKDQAQDLIPKDLKEDNQNKPEEGKIENSNNDNSQSPKPLQPPKKKKSTIITKALAIQMYTVLLIHTGILTIAEYIIHAIQNKNGDLFPDGTTANIVYWIIFAASIGLCLLLSVMVTKINCFTNVPFFVYILYLIILALDLCIFNIGGHMISFDIFVSMLIVFDAASIVILIFCSLIKDNPSSFWIMCSSSGGIILAVFLSTKIYSDNNMLVLIFGVYSFFVYQVMNYNTFNTDKNKKKKGAPNAVENKEEEKLKVPPMMILPYEFNASFIKMFILIVKGIIFIIKGFTSSKKK